MSLPHLAPDRSTRTVANRTGARRTTVLGVLVVLLVTVLFVGAVMIFRPRATPAGPGSLRVSGLPANVSTGVANLMGLTPLPGHIAPGFTLTDQFGHSFALSDFRNRPIVLEFMDPHCTDICPLVSQEFVDAARDLGSKANQVVFMAVNVNRYYAAVSDVAAFSTAHHLDTISTWHFFTGTFRSLRAVWSSYSIDVGTARTTGDVVHTSVVYFIGPHGHERYLASPTADHTKAGVAYLPAGQITAWGHGIATVAKDLLAR